MNIARSEIVLETYGKQEINFPISARRGAEVRKNHGPGFVFLREIFSKRNRRNVLEIFE